MIGWLGRSITMLSAVALISYPPLVWVGLRHWSPTVAGFVLSLLMLPAALVRLLHRDRSPTAWFWVLPLLSAAVLVLAAALNSAGLMMLVPSAVSAALLVLFGVTLLNPPTLLERFAQLQHELTNAERSWCRLWTWVWCSFFVLNATLAALLAWTDHYAWWRVYTGLVSYVLMGVMFATEYILRKYRFGRLRQHWLDRQLAAAFGVWRGKRGA